MDRRFGPRRIASIGMLLLLLLTFPFRARAEDTLFWNTNTSKVSADIRDTDWFRLLRGISAATGWKVYVEPETAHRVSTKFKDLPPGEALRLLLGDVNFAFVPQTNDRPRLYVFRTSAGRATQLMQPARLGDGAEVAGSK